jgi:large subunit ribosomal protein L24
MKIKVNDKVLVISGKDKGKVSKVIRVIAKHDQVVVEKVNMRTKHIKKSQTRAGEKITFEAPMSASNVMIMDPKENKPTRVGYKVLANGKRERISKLSGASLDAVVADTAPAKSSKKKAI